MSRARACSYSTQELWCKRGAYMKRWWRGDRKPAKAHNLRDPLLVWDGKQELVPSRSLSSLRRFQKSKRPNAPQPQHQPRFNPLSLFQRTQMRKRQNALLSISPDSFLSTRALTAVGNVLRRALKQSTTLSIKPAIFSTRSCIEGTFSFDNNPVFFST